MSKGILLILCLAFSTIIAQENADIVKDLPDFPFKGRMFSGYLNVQNKQKQLHYLLIESAQESYTRPLILWLNGGPGCSSMHGLITENGPAIFPDNEETLKTNPYSWHKLGNMLYLESPAGVGFSNINSELEEDNYMDDEISAQENLEALLDFFNKYSRFRQNDFYISGESYAGIYIPRLAAKILEYNEKQTSSDKIRLKGFLVGNGVASWDYDTQPAVMEFAFTHHLISYETRMEYNKVCIEQYENTTCENLIDEIQHVYLKDLNMYDLLQDCWFPDQNSMTQEEIKSSFYYNYAPWAFPKFKRTTSKNKHRNFLSFIEEEDNEKELKMDPPCINPTGPKKYFNREDVQKALHVTSKKWEVCSLDVNRNYHRIQAASLYLYPKLVKSGLKIMIFSGDTDMAVPYNGNQKWIDSLKLEVKSPWRSWRHPDDNENIAGYRTIYEGLTFLTFKGTGHMAIQWKARDAFYMLDQYLHDKDV